MSKGLIVDVFDDNSYTVVYLDLEGKCKEVSFIRKDSNNPFQQFELGEMVDVFGDIVVKSEYPEIFDFNNNEIFEVLTEYLARSAVNCRELRLRQRDYLLKGNEVFALQCDKSAQTIEDTVQRLLSKITIACSKTNLDEKQPDLVRVVGMKMKFIMGEMNNGEH